MMSRETGCNLDTEMASIQQSIEDILTTPIGTRIMRREYGSLLAELLDQPINDSLVLKCYSAIYTAISTWEDRINVVRIQMFSLQKSGLTLDMEIISTTSGLPMNLRIPLKMGAGR